MTPKEGKNNTWQLLLVLESECSHVLRTQSFIIYRTLRKALGHLLAHWLSGPVACEFACTSIKYLISGGILF